jgi:hypothetical protein
MASFTFHQPKKNGNRTGRDFLSYQLVFKMGGEGDTTPQRPVTAVLVRPEVIVALLRVRRAMGRHDGE